MDNKSVYLSDIKGCEVIAIYALKSFIEIVYLKHNKPKSLTIHFHVGGGSMGYFEFFMLDNIPLPFSKTKHPLSGKLTKILDVKLYKHLEDDTTGEELELICEEGNYLLYFGDDEENTNFVKFEKGTKPSYPHISYNEVPMPNELFSVEFFKENLAFSLKAHGEQKTPHGLPYSMHILSVAMEIINALTQEPMSYDEANVAIACALLHDVNEDTTTTITKHSLLAGNSEVIAKGVSALTKDKTLPSKQEQMKDSLERLKKRQHCVGMVKLADRITNLGIPPQHWSDEKKRKYLEEAKLILNALGHTNAYLANKLQGKIEKYQGYLLNEK